MPAAGSGSSGAGSPGSPPHGRIFITDGRGTHRVEIGAMAGNGIETWLAEYVLAS